MGVKMTAHAVISNKQLLSGGQVETGDVVDAAGDACCYLRLFITYPGDLADALPSHTCVSILDFNG